MKITPKKSQTTLTDHLGSTRITMQGTTVAEADLYSAYGEEIAMGNYASSTREKFTGKEFDEDGAYEAGSTTLSMKIREL